MDCLLCGEPAGDRAGWRALFTDRGRPVVCRSCRDGFVLSNDPPPLSDWAGTQYEGMLDGAVSLYAYNEPMKDFLHRYKFMKDVALARVFAEKVADAVSEAGGTVVPIPVHPGRLKERTFSHVDELLKCTGVPFGQMLDKTAAVTLGKMNRRERMAAEPLFRIRAGINGAPGEYVLFDDLYTTGTTLHHAAAALKQAGARRVTAVTLIRA